MFFRFIKAKKSRLTARRFYCLLLCSALLSSCAYSQEKKPTALEPLKAAFPLSPYTQVDEQGIAYGFVPSLVSAISERMGRDIDIQVMPYLRTLHALKTGQIDITFGLRVPESSVYLPDNIVIASEALLILPVSFYALPERNIQINNLQQSNNYRIGTIRLEKKGQRIKVQDQNVYYYKDAYSLSKALQAHHIDLATLEPGSAKKITQQLGLQLERVYDYNHMETLAVFAKASPRVKDPLTLCQSFVEARIKIFNDGRFETLLIDTQMPYLLPYYNRAEITPELCHIATPVNRNINTSNNLSP